MWNGITSTPDGKTLFVYDVAPNLIHAFKRTEGGDLVEYALLVLQLIISGNELITCITKEITSTMMRKMGMHSIEIL